jgi:folate-dependent phosphoribosylglycinamide formyltransferase PurN
MKLIPIGRYSGPTIHFVDEEYDHGKILAQRVVPVLADDTVDNLAARVLKEVYVLLVCRNSYVSRIICLSKLDRGEVIEFSLRS